MDKEATNALAGWLFIGAIIGVSVLWWLLKQWIKARMIGKAVERERRKGRRYEEDE